LIIFLKNDTTFGVSEERPGDVGVFELVDRDFAGERSIGFVKDVLCCDFERRLEMFAGEKEVEGGWCNYDLCNQI
jgi:hypothetical protein